ncbi:MAG: hypothetical protein NT116_05675 [Candidatus Parcubacteria bacterium]|nr:hypothetical protein [Candidatus Parcubacteria bacterium]
MKKKSDNNVIAVHPGEKARQTLLKIWEEKGADAAWQWAKRHGALATPMFDQLFDFWGEARTKTSRIVTEVFAKTNCAASVWRFILREPELVQAAMRDMCKHLPCQNRPIEVGIRCPGPLGLKDK